MLTSIEICAGAFKLFQQQRNMDVNSGRCNRYSLIRSMSWFLKGGAKNEEMGRIFTRN